MPVGLVVFLAVRGLKQSWLVTVLLCTAVAGGVAFQIPNAANLRGYEQAVVANGLVLGNGDVRVRPRNGPRIADATSLAAQLATLPGVTAAVPALTLAGAIGRGGNFKGALVLGVDSTAARVPYHISAGAPIAPGDDTSVVIGTSLAKRLDIHIGDEVQLRVVLGTSWDSLDPENDVGRYTMTVRGLAAGSFLSPEAIIVDRKFLAGELGEPTSASQVAVHLSDHTGSRAVARQIEKAHPEVTAVSWSDDSPFLSGALHASSAIQTVSRTMVWLAVLFPVWALLYVHVLHRKRQIGMLQAVGVSRGEVFAIHVVQAVIVGVTGAAIGSCAGYAIVSWFAAHPIFVADAFVVRPVVTFATFMTPALLVLAATIVAGIVPAWRAARLEPATILRGDA